MGIKWYLKYIWVKLNILVLTPIVWIQNKYKNYKEMKFLAYINISKNN